MSVEARAIFYGLQAESSKAINKKMAYLTLVDRDKAQFEHVIAYYDNQKALVRAKMLILFQTWRMG